MNKDIKFIGGISKNEHTKYHKHLKRKFGKACKCENINCQSINTKRFEWAKRKDRSYTSDADDYIQLCPSCHRKYDFNEDIREKLKSKKRGENNNNSKLKNHQVLEILALIKKGKENKSIATIYNVHPTIISNIKTGKRWSSVTGLVR